MDNLDQNPRFKKDTSYKDTVLKYGLYLAGISIAFTLLSNIFEFNQNAGIGFSLLLGALSIVLLAAFQFMGVKQHKNIELGGIISGRRAFLIAVLIALISAVISSAFNIFYISFIDTEFVERTIQLTIEQLEQDGLSEEQIKQSIELVKKTLQPINQFILSILGAMIVGSIIAGIIALIERNQE